MNGFRIVDVVSIDEYERLLRARMAYLAGYWDEFGRSRDADEPRACDVTAAYVGPPSTRVEAGL